MSNAARRGRAVLWLLLVAAACGAAAFLLLRGEEGAAAPRVAAAPAEERPAADARRAVPVEPGRAALAPARAREDAAEPVAPEPGLAAGGRPDPRSFEGRTALRGHVELLGDLPPPATWTLSLRPSTTLFGREHAEARAIEYPGNQLDFEVRDLPLGGYDVQALAPQRNGRSMPVLLTRGQPSPFLVLELSPASFVDGALVDAASAPVEGLAVALAPADGGAPLSTATDVLGRFRFEGVRDGAYRLLVGDPAGPLLPPRALQVRAPGLTLSPVALPPLCALDVFVLDGDGLFVPDAPVRGSSNTGGVVEGRTDRDGRQRFAHLLPGRWRLRAEHPLEPERTSTRVAVELAAGRTERVELRFLPE